jgi:hypothetical protein
MRRLCGLTPWLLLGLLVPGLAGAGDGGAARVDRSPDCPQSQYSRLNYWAPGVWRFRVHHQPAAPYLYTAPDCAPVTPQPVILSYPCRAVDPATFPYGDLRPLRDPQHE